MCIIAVQMTKEACLTEEQFTECGRGNRDGFGLMYSKGCCISVQKTLVYSEAWEMYQAALKQESFPIVLHWRYGTGGGKGINMVHPFHDETMDWAVVHNGVMTSTEEDSAKESDTSWFAREIVSEISKGYGAEMIRKPSVLALMKHVCGTDKLVFIDRSGTLAWVNKDLFVKEHDGNLLFSNSGYKSWGVVRSNVTGATSGQNGYKPSDRICGCCNKVVDLPFGKDAIQVVSYPHGIYNSEHFHLECAKGILEAVEQAKLKHSQKVDIATLVKEIDDNLAKTTGNSVTVAGEAFKFLRLEHEQDGARSTIEIIAPVGVWAATVVRVARTADVVLVREAYKDGSWAHAKYSITTGVRLSTISNKATKI